MCRLHHLSDLLRVSVTAEWQGQATVADGWTVQLPVLVHLGQPTNSALKQGVIQAYKFAKAHPFGGCRSPHGLPTESMSKLVTRLGTPVSPTLLNSPADCLERVCGNAAPPKGLPTLPRWDPEPLALMPLLPSAAACTCPLLPDTSSRGSTASSSGRSESSQPSACGTTQLCCCGCASCGNAGCRGQQKATAVSNSLQNLAVVPGHT